MVFIRMDLQGNHKQNVPILRNSGRKPDHENMHSVPQNNKDGDDGNNNKDGDNRPPDHQMSNSLLQ
jgi:hypothetical protein